MKHLLILFFLSLNLIGIGQVTVSVTPVDTLVCFRDSVKFIPVIKGSGTSALTYQWRLNGQAIVGGTDSIYSIKQVDGSYTGTYRCIVTVGGTNYTSNDAILQMRPRMYIDTLYRYNPLGCLTECKGQFKALVSGGTPFNNELGYIYEWHAGFSQDTIVFGLCPRNLPYKFTATDSLGCSIDSAYLVDYLKSPKVTFEIKPDTVIYLTNPTVQVAFPDSMRKYITNWTWNFGDSIKIPNMNPVSHTYSDTIKPDRPISIQLKFTDLNGCDTTITNVLTIKKAELDIPNVFTPNGDYVNEKFAVLLMDDDKKDFRVAYLGNELYVYDRWGKKVFNEVDYKSEDWDGGKLSDGTYFYILKLTGQYGEIVKKGSVAILRIKPD